MRDLTAERRRQLGDLVRRIDAVRAASRGADAKGEGAACDRELGRLRRDLEYFAEDMGRLTPELKELLDLNNLSILAGERMKALIELVRILGAVTGMSPAPRPAIHTSPQTAGRPPGQQTEMQ